jgi:GAF domain-containing protein
LDALAKLRQLELDYPTLTEGRSLASATNLAGVAVDRLDVAAVFKALQALSSEIVLDDLIEALLRMTVEHAGAESGVLIVPTHDELLIEAVAVTAAESVHVERRPRRVNAAEIPEAVVYSVARTRQSVLLGDAVTSPEFSTDPFIVKIGCRSVFCLPLLNQSKSWR